MQTRALEEAVALARLDAQVHGRAVAVNGHRHLDAGLALRPDAPEQAGEVAHLLAGDREHDVAVAQIGFLGRAAVGEAEDARPASPRGGERAEPRPRRP